jgi:F-type H+-transporting ATPase subunit gamma
MPSLIDIRRRIRSVKNTQQITKAMKMVSAAKLRRAQERVVAARPYGAMLQRVLSHVAAAAAGNDEISNSPLLAERPEKRIQVILFTSDRGLAGAFNGNLLKATQRFIDEHRDASIELELVGRKGRDFFRRRSYPISADHIGILNKPA